MKTIGLSFRRFATSLKWIDGRRLLDTIEPYRLRLCESFTARQADGRFRFDLCLTGRAKKNWKTADLVLMALYATVTDSPGGHDSECYILANDGDQARDDLALAKKIVRANPVLHDWLTMSRDRIDRTDGKGFLTILPAQDVIGQHGKSYRFVGYDEIHGYRSWDIFEAMQPDPTRLDSQQWITSYASLFHKPGAPLFDLLQQAKANTDPRLLFSWYAADFCTDPDFAAKSPEERANPSMASWNNPAYLAQQQRRLPAHKYRRLHLNLPGLPEGSAYQPEPVMDAIERNVAVRPPLDGLEYVAFVDMSGGSADDAVVCIAHRDGQGRAILDCLQDQGPRPPFDPNAAVTRFVATLQAYRCSRVEGDKYAGETFKSQFETQGISYDVSAYTKSELYDALEPRLNSHSVVLLDVPTLEQQLLGLVWRGGRIDHPNGEHDDYANAAAGAVRLALHDRAPIALSDEYTTQAELDAAARERNAGFLKYLSGKASHGFGD